MAEVLGLDSKVNIHMNLVQTALIRWWRGVGLLIAAAAPVTAALGSAESAWLLSIPVMGSQTRV